MGSRLQLQDLLEKTIGNTNVYLNPPSDISYPAIKYEPRKFDVKYACNAKYISKKCYSLTFISELPNDELVTKLFNLPLCSYDREYKRDDLYHTVLIIYF